MNKPEFVLENKTDKIHCERETDHLIPARRLDIVMIKKKGKRKLVLSWILLSLLTTEGKLNITETDIST